ncbi:MAG: hypothetical protein HFE39_01445 [Clostridiales bacterium]|jgi:hypothetical protein|nr:hypothetical protein [Clostridiales bacterium]
MGFADAAAMQNGFGVWSLDAPQRAERRWKRPAICVFSFMDEKGRRGPF